MTRLRHVAAALWLPATLGLASVSFSHASIAATAIVTRAASAPSTSPPPAVHATPVHFNAKELLALPTGAETRLVLPNGQAASYLSERTIDHGGEITTWIARGVNGDDQRAVITTGPAGTWGWMRTQYGEYRLYPGSAGTDWLAARPADLPRLRPNDARVPSGGFGAETPSPSSGLPTFIQPLDRPKVFATAKSAPTPTTQGDVLIVYTKAIAQQLGAGLMPMLYNLIDSTNQAYIDSEVAFRLRLVNATMLDLPNSTLEQVLDAMSAVSSADPVETAMVGMFAPITGSGGLRDQVGADFVAVVRGTVGNSNEVGLGNLLLNPVTYPTSTVSHSQAYTSSDQCDVGCEVTFAHELGHNMGNAHDRAISWWEYWRATGAGPDANSSVFPYSFGHYYCSDGQLTCDPFTLHDCGSNFPQCANNIVGNFGTIMSYFGPTVMKFSSPSQSCIPPGATPPYQLCGVADQDDNARSMNNVRGAVSAYRNQVFATLPGSVQFKFVAFGNIGGGNTLTFAVSRTGDSVGPLSVDYSVSPLNSVAGINFVATSGTLSWADGDTADKTFQVALFTDLASTTIDTFRATLSHARGTAGAFIGYPNVADGVVLKTWPIITAPATLPDGFATPIGSSAPWGFATDTDTDGDGASLKSGTLNFATGGCASSIPRFTPVPCPSILQADVMLNGGEVAFSYRVGAFPGIGFFEFLVDGMVALQATGSEANADSGWRYTSIPVAAGHHVLSWQYRTDFNFACNRASFDGVTIVYPNCQDHAWIDDVSLPLTAAPSAVALVSSSSAAQVGTSVTFTATVSGSAGLPTGTVSFRDGGTPIPGCSGVVMIGTTATCTTSALSAGSHSIQAVYAGSAAYSESISNTLTQVVTAGAELLSASPPSVDFGGQSMNTTAPAVNVAFTNISASSVTPTSVTVPNAYAIVSNDCTGTLAPSASCTISLSFTPNTQGTVAGVLGVAYPGGGPTIVRVTGVGERSLVTHYYQSVLRRNPDAGGKVFWQGEADRVAALGANINEAWFAMAVAFYFSPEYAAFNRDNTGFVTDLYNTFFNRTPDSGGLAFWKGQLDAGMPREVLLAQFMFSPEFSKFTQAIFGNTSARAEVNAVVDFYRGLLSRLPDTGGFNTWVQQFRTAQCQGAAQIVAQVDSISSSFISSPEYAARKRTNTEYVGDLYNAFLRRGGDLAGVQHWIAQLDTGAQTREQLRQQFVASAEFQGRVSAIVAQGCMP